MAVDEAVLEAVSAGRVPPTLRFYDWQPPCLSIGYTQKVAEFDLERVERQGLGFVRRPSGGRAVLHRQELTYCLCVPGDDWRVAGGVIDAYRRISDGFLAGLRLLGVASALAAAAGGDKALSAACFDAPSRYELLATGKKLIGSAQWRHNGGVLQHGSVPLAGDVAAVVDYLVLGSGDEIRARDVLRRRAGTVSEALGREVTAQEVAQALATGLAEALRIEWRRERLTESEMEAAMALARDKYGTPAWNLRA